MLTRDGRLLGSFWVREHGAALFSAAALDTSTRRSYAFHPYLAPRSMTMRPTGVSLERNSSSLNMLLPKIDAKCGVDIHYAALATYRPHAWTSGWICVRKQRMLVGFLSLGSAPIHAQLSVLCVGEVDSKDCWPAERAAFGRLSFRGRYMVQVGQGGRLQRRKSERTLRRFDEAGTLGHGTRRPSEAAIPSLP